MGTTTNAVLTKTAERHRTPIAAEAVQINRLDRHGEQEREPLDDNCVLTSRSCIATSKEAAAGEQSVVVVRSHSPVLEGRGGGMRWCWAGRDGQRSERWDTGAGFSAARSRRVYLLTMG